MPRASLLSLIVCLSATGNSFADGKLASALGSKLPSAALKQTLPYVQTLHEVLDAVTTRESPTTVRVKKIAAETPSEWIVHRVRADVWVERSATNYLGGLGVKVSIPCQIEFGLDLTMLAPEQFRYDAARRLLVIELPPVKLREPVPDLAGLKVEPKYRGLRNALLDSDAMRGLESAALREDYQPAARDIGLTEVAVAQRRARDLMQEFVRGLFRDAGADVEVIVR